MGWLYVEAMVVSVAVGCLLFFHHDSISTCFQISCLIAVTRPGGVVTGNAIDVSVCVYFDTFSHDASSANRWSFSCTAEVLEAGVSDKVVSGDVFFDISSFA